MSSLAVGFMILIGSFIWGGFAGFLALALRREAAKTRRGGPGPSAEAG